MSNLNMTVAHHLSQDEAIARIRQLLADVKIKYADNISDLIEEWNGNTATFKFSAMGYVIAGTLTVDSSELRIAGDLPVVAMLFKAKIESTIRERAAALLA